MLARKESVLHIIEENFMKDLEYEVLTSVMGMDGYDLSQYFEQLVDYGDLEGMDDLGVEKFETDRDEERQTVSGILRLNAMVGGYVHWDEEDEYMESCEIPMEFSFSFQITDGIYGAFVAEYLE